MMDIAARDQFAAACAEEAAQLRIKYDALLGAGFDHEATVSLMCAAFVRDGAIHQAQMLEAFFATLPSLGDEDE